MAWKNFQNGYPLYASELNNYLMNQSVATFASSTERASVLTSPVEGQVTWLQDTNAFQVYNGSAWVDINDNTDAIQKSLLTTAGDTIYATGSATPARLALGSTGSLLKSNGTAPTWITPGTSGQVLSSTGTDLAWTTPSSGGGMTLLSTTSLSGSSTTISSISQSYKKLIIHVYGVSLSADGAIEIYARNGSTNITHRITGWQTQYNYGAVSSQSVFGTVSRDLKGSNVQNMFSIEIDNYANTGTNANYQKSVKQYGLWVSVDGVVTNTMQAGGLYSANTGGVDTVYILGILGTFNAGTVKIYGVN